MCQGPWVLGPRVSGPGDPGPGSWGSGSQGPRVLDLRVLDPGSQVLILDYAVIYNSIYERLILESQV